MCEPNWEALAEINVRTGLPIEPSHHIEPIYCLCSRVHVKIPPDEPTYAGELEELSESYDVFNEHDCENRTSNMNRVPKEASQEEEDSDANSCYYSASVTHTDNYCTTDEHERDSGADTSEYHAASGSRDCPSKRAAKVPQERSSLPDIFGDEEKNMSWEKHWSENGEQLIWSSWIEKYSDFINPSYKATDGDVANEHTTESLMCVDGETEAEAGGCDQTDGVAGTEIIVSSCSSPPMDDNAPLPDLLDSLLIPRCVSVSSSIPLTIGTTDSMTNVTQMTLSSFGFSRGGSENSQLSESTPSSVSTPSNIDGDETKIELFQNDDSDQHWQLLWQNHFQEEYARHYHDFISKQKKHSTDVLSSSLKESDDACLAQMACGLDEARGGHGGCGVKKASRAIEADIDWNNEDDTNELVAMGLPTTFGRKGHNQRNALQAAAQKAYENVNQNFVKSAFALMGFAFNDDTDNTEGRVIYRKRNIRFHNSFLNMKSRKLKIDGRAPGDDYALMQSKDYSSSDETDSAPKTAPAAKVDGAPSASVQQAITASESLAKFDQEPIDDIVDPLPMEADADDQLDTSKTKSFNRKSKKKRRPNRHTDAMPSEIRSDKALYKYWSKRFSLFSLFDHGIQLDRESWFSVSPEKVAAHTAVRCACDIVIDAFCGAGGNTIQFAKTCQRVIAIDIDPKKIEMAKHNAQIYGVADRIEFIVGDYFALADTLHADVVFLSPPWGGPEYLHNDVYDIETALQPKPASTLMQITRQITPNIAIYLPRNTNTQQLLMLAGPGNSLELEQGFLDRKLIAITAYYGNLLNTTSK